MHKTRRGGSVRVLVTLSALSAIGIILGKFLAFNVTEFMRFSLENTTIILSGILFGPIYGAAVGAVQDIVGCIAVGYTINPIITLGSTLIGATSGLVYSRAKRFSHPLAIVLTIATAHLIGSVIVKTVGLSIYYASPFVITLLWRTLNYIIVGSIESILLITLLKSKQLLAQINKITPFTSTLRFESMRDAASYTKNVSGVFSKPGLERVELLLKAVGSPEKKLKVVHVTGTNGKGSFIAFLVSILKAAGLKVGSFTSPYLLNMNESICIGGEPIKDGELISVLARLRPIADGMIDKPTEFELLTAAAYLTLHEAGVDIAVIECGMGAMRDATNVITSPLLSVITGISVDHTAFLGSTEREIAGEKAGIIKKGCPLLIGSIDGDALEVITSRANELGAKIITSEVYSISSFSLDGTLMDCAGIEEIRLPLLGVHQPKNAALSITAAKLLSKHFPTITNDCIKSGIADTEWHGRFEILKSDPIFIFDGAHNLDGIRSAVESIKTYFTDKIVCITGVLADKEYELMADELSSVVAYAVTVTPDNPRALSGEDYAEVLASRGINSVAKTSVTDAVNEALDLARKNGLAVVCLGSLYLYKDVSEAVKLTLI